MYEIEKNVPIPDVATKQHQNKKYPFDNMDVGDSFLVQSSKDAHYKTRHAIAAYASVYGKKNGKKFTSLGNESDFTVRVWRVE